MTLTVADTTPPALHRGVLHGEGQEDGGGGGQGDSLGQAPAHVGEPRVENDD